MQQHEHHMLTGTHLVRVEVAHLGGANDAVTVQIHHAEPVPDAGLVGLVLLRHQEACAMHTRMPATGEPPPLLARLHEGNATAHRRHVHTKSS